MSTAHDLPEIATLLHPIRDDAPAGDSLLYSARWDAIVEARSSEIDLPRGEWQRTEKRADWALVERLCIDALVESTKDLQIAVWLAEAWMHLAGLDGLRAATNLLAALHERFSLTMFPNSGAVELLSEDTVEHRTNLLRSFNTRSALEVRFVPISFPAAPNLLPYTLAQLDETRFRDQAMRRDDPSLPPDEYLFRDFDAADAATPQRAFATLSQQVQAALTSLGQLDELLDRHYGRENTGLGAIRGELQRVALHLLPRLRPECIVAQPVPEDVAEDDTPQNLFENGSSSNGFGYDGLANPQRTQSFSQEAAPIAPGTASFSRTGPANRAEAYEMIRLAGKYLSRTEPHSPVPYLLKRALRWGSLSLQDLLPELLQHPEQLSDFPLHNGGDADYDDPFRD